MAIMTQTANCGPPSVDTEAQTPIRESLAALDRLTTPTARELRVQGARFRVAVGRRPRRVRDGPICLWRRAVDPTFRRLLRMYNRRFNRFWARVASGGWEPRTFDWFEQLIDPERVVLDIGAWIGPTTLFAATRARRVFAVEPDPIASHSLEQHVTLNPEFADRIVRFEGCVTDRDGPVVLRMRGGALGGNSQSSVVDAEAGDHAAGRAAASAEPGGPAPSDEAVGWRVAGLRLESFARLFELDRAGPVGLVKIDVEGAEAMILADAASWLAERRASVHLSLHGPLMIDPSRELSTIARALAAYPKVVDETGDPIDLDELTTERFRREFVTLIARF